MGTKVMVPVFPSERFYDAVVGAAEIIGRDGGLITFAFTRVRPSAQSYDADADGRPAELDVSAEAGDYDAEDLEAWRAEHVAGLDEARKLLYERGVRDNQIDYLFADEADTEGTAQAIADEAAAGAYDLVVLSRGYFEDEVKDDEATPADVAAAVQAIDGVKLLVT